ncbi:hypothetical protein AHAS_Ahas16G0203000 [Arachis hypogaea]
MIFYAKCIQYGKGCDWLIRVSKICRKCYWEIRKYNGSNMWTMHTISQDHSKLNSDITAKVIRQLVEANSSLKVQSIIAEV